MGKAEPEEQAGVVAPGDMVMDVATLDGLLLRKTVHQEYITDIQAIRKTSNDTHLLDHTNYQVYSARRTKARRTSTPSCLQHSPSPMTARGRARVRVRVRVRGYRMARRRIIDNTRMISKDKLRVPF